MNDFCNHAPSYSNLLEYIEESGATQGSRSIRLQDRAYSGCDAPDYEILLDILWLLRTRVSLDPLGRCMITKWLMKFLEAITQSLNCGTL